MNLYLVSQNQNNDYDTYDSFVIAADTANEAQATHPGNKENWGEKYDTWCISPEFAKVKLIGKAAKGISGIICSSFNPG